MTDQPSTQAICGPCEALVAQCEARIGAANGNLGLDSREEWRMAARVARIVLKNRQWGRVPVELAASRQTGVPDSYVDRVLRMFCRESPTVESQWSGDEAVWERMLTFMQGRAFGYLVRSSVTAGQADQLAQACSVMLWEGALESFPFDTPLDAWASRVVEYSVSQWCRSVKEQRQQYALSLDAAVDAFPTVPTQGTLYDVLPDQRASRALDAVEARLVLEEAVHQLASDSQREVVLRQLAGRRDPEIAAEMGRSVQAVYNLRHRALRAMRRELGGVVGSG